MATAAKIAETFAFAGPPIAILTEAEASSVIRDPSSAFLPR
jgi:hypothetical protein